MGNRAQIALEVLPGMRTEGFRERPFSRRQPAWLDALEVQEVASGPGVAGRWSVSQSVSQSALIRYPHILKKTQRLQPCDRKGSLGRRVKPEPHSHLLPCNNFPASPSKITSRTLASSVTKPLYQHLAANSISQESHLFRSFAASSQLTFLVLAK